MKKLSLFNILLCSFVVLFILGSCSLTVQDYDSASLEIRLPVSSAASQGRALVSTNSGKVYLCLIRANGSAEYFSKPVPSNGKVTFTGMQAGSYADILVFILRGISIRHLRSLLLVKSGLEMTSNQAWQKLSMAMAVSAGRVKEH